MAATFQTPPPAAPGDKVAVLAPSSGGAANARHVLDLSLRRLREQFDVRPVVYPTARQSDAFLARNPRARAADLHAAFRDPEISAVFATIGGDDQVRVLDYLDPDLLGDHPTRFFGMSDNTNVALYLWTHGVVSYYGGQLLNQVGVPGTLDDYSERYLRRALFDDHIGALTAAERWTDAVYDWETDDYVGQPVEYEDAPGWSWYGDRTVTGRVWGGCLAIVRWQLATNQYLPDPARLDGQVLAIETSEELPDASRVRWTLQAMGERGLLERFDGVLVGRPRTRNRFEDRDDETRERYREDQREAVLSMLDRYNPDATAVFDLDFGHTNPTAPIPIGGRVEIDPGRERVRFE